MFGVFQTARANKENIFYAIVTVVLLERVRTGWNRIEGEGRKTGRARSCIARRQDNHVIKASLLYALPFLLPVVKYIYRSVAELSASVPGLHTLENTWAFFGVFVLTECFLALVIYNLLKVYIDRMNSAIGFFTKIGRNVWDGSRMAVQMSSDLGSHVIGRTRRLARRAVGATRVAATLSVSGARRASRPLVALRRRFRGRTLAEGGVE